jgi:hypothetical protein
LPDEIKYYLIWVVLPDRLSQNDTAYIQNRQLRNPYWNCWKARRIHFCLSKYFISDSLDNTIFNNINITIAEYRRNRDKLGTSILDI